jgi:RNA ligase (TIGR02306 family)
MKVDQNFTGRGVNMSQHIAEVVPVLLRKHDNADTLSIATVKGWQCVVKTDDFKGVTKGIYIPIDCVVPDTSEWKWLENRRIKTHKFRGVISQGLLIPAKPSMNLGEDVTEELGITRYVPKQPNGRSSLRGGYNIPPPPGMYKYTDIENWKNHTDIFDDNDVVIATEKIHGANARFALLDGCFYVGSHNTVRMPILPEPTSRIGKWWIKLMRKMEIVKPQRKPDEWQIVSGKYDIENKMRMTFGVNEYTRDKDVILYGEIYGPKVQKLDYSVPVGETHVRFFDISINGKYLGWEDMCAYLKIMGLDHVPVVTIDTFNVVKGLADGKSLLGNHIREGIVIKPYPEEQPYDRLGRRIIKMISDKYLLKDIEELPEDEN